MLRDAEGWRKITIDLKNAPLSFKRKIVAHSQDTYLDQWHAPTLLKKNPDHT